MMFIISPINIFSSFGSSKTQMPVGSFKRLFGLNDFKMFPSKSGKCFLKYFSSNQFSRVLFVLQ